MGLQDQLLSSYAYIKDPRWAVSQPPRTQEQPSGGLTPMVMAMMMKDRAGGRGGSPNLNNVQSGGIDELIWQQPGHWTHLHLGDADLPMKRIARKLEHKGFDVGELEGFRGEGQVSSGHTTNSMHYEGNALDLNYNGGGRWGSEDEALDWAYNWLRRRFG